jgi:DNA-binding NtrC family response regulator
MSRETRQRPACSRSYWPGTKRQFDKPFQSIFCDAGHQVFGLHSPLEIVELAQPYKGHIDVLLTDVVMAGLSGTELAQRVAASHSGIHIYARICLQKPFRLQL